MLAMCVYKAWNEAVPFLQTAAVVVHQMRVWVGRWRLSESAPRSVLKLSGREFFCLPARTDR